MGATLDVRDAAIPEALGPVKLLFAAVGVAQGILLPFFPLFLRGAGFSVPSVGAVLSATALTAFVFAPVWGYAADRRCATERVLALALFGCAPAGVLLYVVHARTAVVVAAVVLFACTSAVGALSDTVALQRLDVARRNRYGTIRLWLSLGFAVSAVAGGALFEAAGVHSTPLVYGLAAALAAVWLVVRFGVSSRAPQPPRRRDVRELVRGRTLAFLVSVFMMNVGFREANAFLAIKIVGIGGGMLLVGAAASLQALAEVPVMRWTGRVSRIGGLEYYMFGAVAYVGVFVAWGLARSPLAATCVSVFAGIAFALTSVGSVVVVDELVPARLRASAQSALRAVGQGLAPVVGLATGGLIYGYYGPMALFASAAACAGIGAILTRVTRARTVAA